MLLSQLHSLYSSHPSPLHLERMEPFRDKAYTVEVLPCVIQAYTILILTSRYTHRDRIRILVQAEA